MNSPRNHLFSTLLCLALLTTASEAQAVTHAQVSKTDNTGRMFSIDGPRLRQNRHLSLSTPTVLTQAKWRQFVRTMIGWRALWDVDTHTPVRMWGPGIEVPGSVQSAQIAERFAKQFIRDNKSLLAPGATQRDFAVVSNVVHGGIRSIGMQQTAFGFSVEGGQMSFRFKNDRLYLIGSEALPNIPKLSPVRSSTDLSLARSWLKDLGHANLTKIQQKQPVVLPLVYDSGAIDYQLVIPVRAKNPTKGEDWTVFVETTTGDVIAAKQENLYIAADILFNAPQRHPQDTRANFPAAFLQATVNAEQVITQQDGSFDNSVMANSADIELSVQGEFVAVQTQQGSLATTSRTFTSGEDIVWSAADDEFVDAQLTTYIHANIAKDYVRDFAPSLSFIDEVMIATVNIDDACNAFSDGTTINFFASNERCQNTARLPDVVYHEIGHAVHRNSLIPGVGRFDRALSEGLSDYLASSITKDPGMGRGFFYTNDPLRHIDPPGSDAVWPQDIGEIHQTGLIFAGAMWDLRKQLISQYGESEGETLVNRLYYAVMQRATDIPSTLIEVLAEDDDDGDLTNGTPNQCAITTAFSKHGLRATRLQTEQLSVVAFKSGFYPLAVTIDTPFPLCAQDQPTDVVVRWRPQNTQEWNTVDLLLVEPLSFGGGIPGQANRGIYEYQYEITFTDGTKQIFPKNPAQQYYQFYVGDVVPLYCHDFETDPFTDGWTHGLLSGNNGTGADDWEWGTPAGKFGDPGTAFGGEFSVGNDLGNGEFNGAYQNDVYNFVETPDIDLGQYSDVRLQYRRWLQVEDGFFDRARIVVDSNIAWENANSNTGDSSMVHHQDEEWIFHDVPITPHIVDTLLRLRFELETDAGLELGGWNIDNLCIVANPDSICGDGRVSASEQCDDGTGNSDAIADACRSTCKMAFCGDGVIDAKEQCDDGNNIDDDDCSSLCIDPNTSQTDIGCQGSGSHSLWLWILGLLAIIRGRNNRSITSRLLIDI